MIRTHRNPVLLPTLYRLTKEPTMSKTATVAGFRVPSDLADVISHAVQNGWVVEARKPKGLSLKSPDKSVPPVTFGVEEVTVNHVKNVRNTLRRHGLTFGSDDTPQDTPEEAPEATQDATTPDAPHEAVAAPSAPIFRGKNRRERVQEVSAVVPELLRHAGMPVDAAHLLSFLISGVDVWLDTREAVDSDLLRDAEALADTYARERDAARKERDALDAALTKAAAREERARKDCGEALDRARKAEEERDALQRRLDTLRSALAG